LLAGRKRQGFRKNRRSSSLIPPPSSLRPHPSRSAAFPLSELYIAIVLIVLIALGLYFFAGAWGVFLLWCLALVFVLPQGLAAIALLDGAREERGKGRRAVAAACYAGALLWILLWLAGAGYCAYSGYQAYRALP
jgi:hypothetical protein